MATKFRFNYNNQTVDFDDYYVRSDIFTQGNLWSWGFNGSGGLGDNTVIHRSSPVQVISGGANWKSVSIGYQQTAAIKTDGTLWMFGDNTYGCLGNNSNTSTSSPVQTITGGNNWIQIWAGVRFNTAIKTDGSLWCWGRNANGQLGDNTVIDKSSPVQVLTFSQDWLQSSCGYRHAACIKTDGTLWCWGYNGLYGALGDNTGVDKSSPIQVVGAATNWIQTACGYYFTGGLKTDGTLWFWGRNNNGQLGDNTVSNKSSPVQTAALGTNWKSFACGWFHTAAIKADGTLWTWGNNYNGQLGDNTRTHRSSPVQTVTLGTNWKQVSCGSGHTAAIKTDGTLWAWGVNYGNLGDNTSTRKSSPVQTVAATTNWKQVACGNGGTYAIKTDGTLWVWGGNSFGQAGTNEATAAYSSPVQTFGGGNTWKLVVAGRLNTFAIRDANY